MSWHPATQLRSPFHTSGGRTSGGALRVGNSA